VKVSVIMANYRGGKHLLAAVSSVLRQSHADLELIVSDDASPDDSTAILRQAMVGDGRLRLIEAVVNGGPSAARNRALDAANGDWIAIVDSDDLLHPQRLERLLAAAERLGADIIADDLVFFGETVASSGQTLLQPLDHCAPMTVTTSLYLEASGERGRIPPLGYLKPLIRRSLIGALRYDETLRIGEDYDFTLRLLLAGARFVAVPDPMYLYRRHDASISHRLSESAVGAMLAAHDRVAATAENAEQALLARRRRGLLALRQYEHLVGAIRDRRAGDAVKALLRHPGLVLPLARSFGERVFRVVPRENSKETALLRLGIGLPDREEGKLSLACLELPEPGGIWSEPPARLAARLSRLSARYELSFAAEDTAGAWAAELLPSRQSAGTASDTGSSGPSNP
jgi:succinoglycan biosynthesis protein ExoO